MLTRLINQILNMIRFRTIGRVQRQLHGAQARRMMGVQNKIMRGVDKGIKAADPTRRGAGGKAGHNQPASAQRPPSREQAKAEKKKVGLFSKKNKGGLTCINGHELDPAWEVCPYCGQAAAAGAAPGAGPDGNKTEAIDISSLEEQLAIVGWLVALNGNHRGQDFRIVSGKNIIGTTADCDIVITDQYLSSKHATIRYDDGNFTLIDLDSTNGTFVNDKKITKEDLIDNDKVRLGRTEFKFKSLF